MDKKSPAVVVVRLNHNDRTYWNDELISAETLTKNLGELAKETSFSTVFFVTSDTGKVLSSDNPVVTEIRRRGLVADFGCNPYFAASASESLAHK